jgi:hypothetical protein
MTEISPLGAEATAAVEDLRAAMDRVRALQAGSLDVGLADYDASTNQLNQVFLGSFLRALPVELGFPEDRGGAHNFIFRRAVEAGPVRSYGLFVNDGHRTYSGFVIGERPSAREKFTEILVAGRQRKGEGDERQEYPVVYSTNVLTDQWQALRTETVRNLAMPPDHERLMEAFDSQLGAWVLWHSTDPKANANPLGIPSVTTTPNPKHFNRKVEELPPKAVIKAVERYGAPEKGNYRSLQVVTRGLRGTDFTEFDVPRHLHYLAAAFGIGGVLDELKAARAAQLPAHPADQIAPGYLELTEAASTLSVTPPAAANP